ncbi:uncharacterized protein BDZ99DRAFT_422208 [Mytilinidion resinicola]|uniref:Rhodopsin domain-containing protein n=1 Tax=Mytilinidion resinicola TaxID=574789 RepID=A0A6A6YEG0_9PEZI|nr:uncharacterized protein BDZ99DRAFT_422208 [Mytilinidion resinicola]KAF2806913.1 hypothetical protein BDZ99DRAFT_422208 [Mytilinidion resinicola]
MESNPSHIDLSASRQPQIWAAIGTTYALAVICVALRFLARRLVKFTFWLDDWLVLGALAILTALIIETKYWTDAGMGRHVASFPPAEIPGVYEKFFKGLFMGWIIYIAAICVVKFSVLAFYWRIFQYTSIRIPIWILTGITACWGLSTILVIIFQCTPISSFWSTPQGPAVTCSINYNAFFISSAIPHILTDVAILCLPLPYIFTIQRPLPQKLAITAIFMLGGFVVVIAILRLVYLAADSTDDLDVTWAFVNVAIWTNCECSVAVVSACLPSLRPVMQWVFTGSPHSKAGSSEGRPVVSLPSWRSSRSRSNHGIQEPPACIVKEGPRHQYRFVHVSAAEETPRCNIVTTRRLSHDGFGFVTLGASETELARGSSESAVRGGSGRSDLESVGSSKHTDRSSELGKARWDMYDFCDDL